MKKIYSVIFLLFTVFSFSQNFGSFASGIKINSTIYNTTASAPIHQINPDASAQNFDAVSLGTFGQNATCARITGAEIKTFKNTLANVCSASLLWRVYPTSSTPSGVFNTISLATVNNCDLVTSTFDDGFGPCGNGDQKWKTYSINQDFIASLLPGNYTLEIYYDYTGSNSNPATCETTKTINNSGANYKANFIIANPTCNPVASPTILCQGETLNLTANPANGIAPYTYSWSGPNGYSSTTENPSITNVTASNNGTYSLIVTDSCGAVSSSQTTENVTVTEKSDPFFEGLNPGLCRFGTPPLLPSQSTNGIFGTWNPDTVNNSTVGTFFYTFTPNAGQCANVFVQTIFVVNNVNPTFTLPAAICLNSVPPILNTTSNNGIVGTWNPTTVSNTTSGSYVFTANGGQCANTRTVTINVTPNVTPSFTLPTSICQNGPIPALPTTSSNGITGTWNPSIVNNTATTTYQFTPNNASQCGIPVSRTITVNPNLTPTFNAIAPICENATAPTLQSTSNNGFTGTWNPSTVSNTASGTYTFTPNSGQCATSTTLDVTVNPNVTPTFDPIPNVCYLTTPPSLPSNSLEGITGTWNPLTISNTASGTYTFTPTAGLCALATTLNVTVTIITPTFDTINPICSGTTAPTLAPTSNNGISGNWNPSSISNTTSGSYTFTPNANQCATTLTISVTVNPSITPSFTLPTSICQNGAIPALPTTSSNGITGTWNPSIVNNTATTTYQFTPNNASQCGIPVSRTITVNPNLTPTFNAIAPICENATAPTLQSTSNNGFTGTWNPSTVSNTASGTYTFTPNSGQCATSTTLDVTVNPNVTPTFDPIPNVCYLTTPPSLPSNSLEGITGTWNPLTISNTASGTYTFTPTAGLCALATTLNVTVTIITPTFDTINPICSGTTAPTLAPTSNNGISGNWNPSSISNTTSGSYTFTPNANQCATTLTISVTVNPSITPSFTLPTSICQNGAIPALPTTSSNGITGTWNPSIVNNTATTTYQFTPNNASQCGIPVSRTITVNPNLTPTFNAIAPICENATAPTLQSTSNNGFTGTWNPSIVSNTASGTYTFTPTSGQCATTTTLNVTVNPNVTPTFDPLPPVCLNSVAPILSETSTNGITGTWNPSIVSTTNAATYTFTPNTEFCANNISINVTISPNIIPTFNAIPDICYQTTSPVLSTTSTNEITGTWNPQIISNTASGTYTFTPNPNQCASTTTLSVNVTIITPVFNTIPPVCNGSSVPNLQSTSNNGISGTWNPATISNTQSATYTFTPNANQCAITTSISVTVNTITPTFNAIADVCYGTTSPNLQTVSNNGITGTWNPSTISNTASGNYTFTPNPNQCAVTTSILVNVTTINPTFNIASSICENSIAPILSNTSNNGITGTWNPTTISNTNSGSYTFTPNANQCATTTTINVTVNPNVTPTFNEIPPLCYQSVAPTLPITSTNGIDGTWNPSEVSNTTSGSYTFTPNTGICALPISIQINVNTIVPIFTQIAPVCFGATPPTFTTTSNNGITGIWNPATISNTTPGTYTFTPNANQCATIVTMTIEINSITPTFNSIAAICENATVPTLQTTSNNGITGTWNPNSVNNSATTVYTFTPDANLCATTVSITIVVNPIVTPTFTAIPDVCYNTTSPVLPTTSNNGINGTWNPATISNTTSNVYTFTPNVGECAVTTTLSVNVTTINPTFNAITPICENAIAPVLPTTSTNGITGTWNPALVSNTATGSYTFTPNANQCATTEILSVTVNPNVTPIFDAIPTICYNTTPPILQGTSTNGISGTWNPSTISSTTAATYTFTPNAGICATTTTLTTIINTIIPNFNPIADVCFGSTPPTLPTTSTNGITGTWNPATVSNTTPTTYTFTPDANQCAIVTTLQININVINPTFTAVADVCFGSTPPTLPTTSTNGITGTWNPLPVSNTTPTLYTFTPDANQCATTATLQININSITPTFASVNPICEGSTAPILPTTSLNNITGTWNALVDNTATGTYTFTPDANQCATTVSLTVVVNTKVVPLFTFGTSGTGCQGVSSQVLITQISTNGITGTWSPNTLDYSILGSTIYTFTPNAGECALSTSYSLFINPNITPTFNAIAPLCSGSLRPILPLTSLNGYTGTWNPGIVSTSSTAIYTFTPTSGQCATATTLTVTINPSPTDLAIIVSNVLNQTAQGVIEITSVTSGVAPFQYSINNGSFSNTTSYTNLLPGDYIISVKDANGCKYDETVTIETTCIFPNGISPNGDGKNDTFNLNGCNVKFISFFNRYGMKINSFSNYTSQWDGTTSDAKNLPDGTYFYSAELTDGNVKTGWVYIAR